MTGFTNRGKGLIFKAYFRGANAPMNFYIALVTESIAPSVHTNVLGDLIEIPAGNGYTAGGLSLSRNESNFDLAEAATPERGELNIIGVKWIANGGNLPITGNGFRYAVLTDDNPVIFDRQVIAYWDLGANRVISDSQELKLSPKIAVIG